MEHDNETDGCPDCATPTGKHPTRTVSIRDDKVEVDVELADLVEALNSLGIWTTFCCQGDEGEYAYIEFAHTGYLEHFLTVAADFAEDADMIIRMESAINDFTNPRPDGWHLQINWQSPGAMSYYGARTAIQSDIDAGIFDGSWSSNVIAYFPRRDIEWLTETFTQLASDVAGESVEGDAEEPETDFEAESVAYGVLCDFFWRNVVNPGEEDDEHMHTSSECRRLSNVILERLNAEGFAIRPA